MADGEKLIHAPVALLPRQPVAVIVQFVRRMAAHHVDMHTPVQHEGQRVDLLDKRGRGNQPGPAGHHELHPLGFPSQRRREDDRIGAGKADGHQERIDAVSIGATAKLQLRFKGQHAGKFLGPLGATKRRARLGEAPVEPQGLVAR